MDKCQNRAKKKAIDGEYDFWRAFKWLEEKGIFPEAGQLLDQSQQFIYGCEIMRSYSAAHKAMKEKSADRISKIKKRRGK